MDETRTEPLRQYSDVVDKPDEHRQRLYSVPRRFDLATIFVVTAAYSIFLGSLTALHAPTGFVILLAAFITVVGIGQALLFRGLKPRRASILGGLVIFGLLALAITYFGNLPRRFFVFLIVGYTLYGAMSGYVAGVIVGGVFLLADVLRRRYRRPID